MKHIYILFAGALVIGFGLTGQANAAVCEDFGPQTPRDISNKAGTNANIFNMAPASKNLNLCNIHFHTNAEHKGPGFSVSAGNGEHGGYQCNETSKLTKVELSASSHGHSACHGLNPGDTVEVHWVYSSCTVEPGESLGACLSDKCKNPQLRVETQVFLAVNDPNAADFASFTYDKSSAKGLHQPKALPSGTGKPVVFPGSTTGTSYTESTCSPYQVTWSVRPACTKVNIATVNKWCEGNVFKENHAHGVRQLVTNPELLAPMK